MSDDLRTRIVTAIWDALDRQRFVGFGPFVDRETGEIDTSGSDGIDMDAVADAVIAELNPDPPAPRRLWDIFAEADTREPLHTMYPHNPEGRDYE